MPRYDFKCYCGYTSEDVFLTLSKIDAPHYCPICNKVMKRQFPVNTHFIWENQLDGKDAGKMIAEKNNKLKEIHSGYSYEQKSLKEKCENLVNQKL